MNKLALGTVQFGLPYGISNSAGKTSPSDVQAILDYAYQQDIKVLDTAAMYGNAEEVLGLQLANIDANNWRIITKTPHFTNATIVQEDVDSLNASFEASVQKLGSQPNGLLIHACDDLFKPSGSQLYDAMLALKRQGKVGKIGASVYDARQIDQLLDHYEIDLVQLPLNILDQRLLASGHLRALKARGVEVHVRSLFLQGLLLIPVDAVDPWFAPIKPQLSKFHEMAEQRSMSGLALALAYVLSLPEVDHAVVGVNDGQQLKEIVQAANATVDPSDFKHLAVDDVRFVNPSNWKLQ